MFQKMVLFLSSLTLFGQTTSTAILTNLATAEWSHDKGDPPGSESVLLKMDPATRGMELLVRFPAGHVFAPHWHESNERIVVLEGRLSVGQATLEPGGFAFLPAHDVLRLKCSAPTRCTLYLSWDGNPKSHPAK